MIVVDSDLAREEHKKIFAMDFGFGFNPIYLMQCLDWVVFCLLEFVFLKCNLLLNYRILSDEHFKFDVSLTRIKNSIQFNVSLTKIKNGFKKLVIRQFMF